MFNRDEKPPHLNQNEQSLTAWLTLYFACGMQSHTFNRLFEHFGSPESILGQDEEALQGCGINPGMAVSITDAGQGRLPDSCKIDLENSLDWLQKEHHCLLSRQCADYPVLLNTIPDPPPLLFVSGNHLAPGLPMIAMVGSRQPSAGGRRTARRFARDFALAGLGIASGLAMGIDAESHQGALDGGGQTIAVLGAGIDQVYPACNRGLYEAIEGNGALISEFGLGSKPLRQNFPRRNRIISGLSLGVLVVEAGVKSGSMITARFALEQGREVFAIPGSIHNPVARGCHKLINEGARLVQSTAEIVEECTGLLQGIAESLPKGTESSVHPGPETGNPVLEKVYAALGYDPVSIDTLVMESGLKTEQAAAALTELEMQGIIRREQGGFVLAGG